MSYLFRLKTYLSPNVPEELYKHVTQYLNKRLNAKIQLIFESQRAGPDCSKPDPFSLNEIDSLTQLSIDAAGGLSIVNCLDSES